MRSKITVYLIILAAIVSCKSTHLNFSHPYEKISTLPGPEDMVLDTLGYKKRIIIACASRRTIEEFQSGIQAYNLDENVIENLPIQGLPDTLHFNPHGIDIGQFKGNTILWVINHEDEKNRQSILRFIVKESILIFDTVYFDKTIISPNDICDGGHGTFYFTNDAASRNSGMELLLKIKGGTIVYYNGYRFDVFNKNFAYPNGIIKFKKQLYFSTSRQNRIFSIKLNADGSMMKDSLRLVTKGMMWDNFSVNGDHLVCTSHTHPIKFLKHRHHEKHMSPCQVYTINPVTKTKGIVYNSDGESISAGSTAIYYAGNLYICQVFDPYILKIHLTNY